MKHKYQEIYDAVFMVIRGGPTDDRDERIWKRMRATGWRPSTPTWIGQAPTDKTYCLYLQIKSADRCVRLGYDRVNHCLDQIYDESTGQMVPNPAAFTWVNKTNASLPKNPERSEA